MRERPEFIGVKVSEAEKALVRQAAEIRGLDLSTHARELLVEGSRIYIGGPEAPEDEQERRH